MTTVRFVGELPLWVGLILSLLVCGLSWRYYRRESFDLPRRLRWLLPLLRSLAFFLGIMVLTQPVLHHRKVIGELGRVQIYVDASQSMGLRDSHMPVDRKLLIARQQGWISQAEIDSGHESVAAAQALFDETTRWRRAERSLLQTANPLFEDLKQHHNVEVLALHNQQAVELLTSLNPAGPATDLGRMSDAPTTDLTSGISSSQTSVPLTESGPERAIGAAPAASGKLQAAIVLLTDGQHNSGPSPLQTARVLGSQGVAFFPVSLGADQPPPDLAVTGLEHPQQVYRKDRVRGVVLVRDQMPAGVPFVVEISHDGSVLWQKQLLTEESGERRVDFELSVEGIVDKLGGQLQSGVTQHTIPLALTAAITPLQGESEAGNNQQIMRLAAVMQSNRMLILDGRPRWETRYLRNAFERDSQWDVTAVIAGIGTDHAAMPRGTQQDQFPETREGLFEYDLILFGEIARDLFADHELQWIREFVEIRGGGIVFVDGHRGTLQQFTEKDLQPLIPVRWGSTLPATQPTSLQLTDKGSREPALAFELDTQANRRFWTELPAPHSINRVEILPGTEVLVEAMLDGQPVPAIVTRNYGAGHVLFFAFDETWRWRYKVADTYHQRLWNQLARYVMPRAFSASDEFVAVDTGPVSYGDQSAVDVRVRLRGLDGRPQSDATVDALIWKDGRVVGTTSLTADGEQPGIYRGNTGALADGQYEVSVQASGFSPDALKARGQFVVRPPESAELAETACNETLLKQLAAESGGVYLREEQLGQLPALLSPLSNGRVVESDTLLWQTYWWFAGIVVLLSVEWFLRKRAGLL